MIKVARYLTILEVKVKSKPKSILLSGPCLCSYVLAGVLIAAFYLWQGEITLASLVISIIPIPATWLFGAMSKLSEAMFGISAAMNGGDGDEAA